MGQAMNGVTVPRAADRTEGRWYSICGQLVRSEVALPVPSFPNPDAAAAAWTIRLGRPADRRALPAWLWPDVSVPSRQSDATPTDQNGVAFHRYQLGPDGTWLWWDGLAAVHVSPDARGVEVFPEANADERMLGLLLAGPLTAVVLGQLGYPLLHASAVTLPAGAVAFLGPKGQGKSTIAAAFLRRGARLLTDDMLLLRQQGGVVHGVPGPAVMKVWKATAEHTLGLTADALPNVAAMMEKKLFWIDDRQEMAVEPAPLRALYVLDRREPSGDDAAVESLPLHGQQALAAVIAQAYGPLLSTTAIAKLLPTFGRLVKQAPVRVLRYPSGFDRQDAVDQFVRRDLERA